MSDPKQSRKEMQEKLNKQYIDSKINPIIEPMALQLFQGMGANENPVSIFHLTILTGRFHA